MQLATSTQLHTNDESYTKNIAKFLGHTVNTHKEYYEMPLPLIQKVLVGKKLVNMTRIEHDKSHSSEPLHISYERNPSASK